MKPINPEEDRIYRERQSRVGKRGGKTTLGRHGTEFYSVIAKKRWKDIKLKAKKD